MLADHLLFCDAEALVIDKPAGLAVTPPRDGGLSLENHLQSLRFGFQRSPQAVHRLDRDTSGCLLLSRNPRAHRRYAAAFEGGAVEKTYLAVLEGVPAEAEGVVELALAKVSSREAGWRIVPDPKGKAARTHWQVVDQAGGRALVRFRPATGRTHQLRVHAASGIGLPIVGDPVYGRNAPSGLLLHASALRLERGAKEPIVAQAPLPERFRHAGFGDGTGVGNASA